jgi:hypothetical protein
VYDQEALPPVQAPAVPTTQLYEQALVNVALCVSAPSVPQEAVAGVQDWLEEGAAPVQKLFATVVPSVRTQETLWV